MNSNKYVKRNKMKQNFTASRHPPLSHGAIAGGVHELEGGGAAGCGRASLHLTFQVGCQLIPAGALPDGRRCFSVASWWPTPPSTRHCG